MNPARWVSPRTLLLLSTAGAVCFAAGCSSYQPRPLDQAAAGRPALQDLRVAASRLDHPFIQPLVIDGRDGYTPDEITVLTVLANPRLRALRAQQQVADAQVLQAGILPNPQLGYSVDRPHGNADPTLVPGRNLGLNWEVTSLLGRHDRVTAARMTARSLNLSIAWQEWQEAEAARLDAYRIVSLDQRLAYAQQDAQELADVLALARKAYDARQMTAADLAATVDAWNTAQEACFSLQQELTTSWLALNLALGQPAETRFRIKSSPEQALAAQSIPAADTLLNGLEKHRLDLVALQLGYDSQEATLRAAIKAQFPKIGLGLSKSNDTTPIYTRGLSLTIDLPLFDRNQGQIAIETATREQLYQEYAARVAEARSDVRQVLENLSLTRTRLEAVEAQLPDRERLAGALDAAYRTRNVNLQAWRDARSALLSRRIDESRLRQDLRELTVALELATGRSLVSTGPAQPNSP